jgi:hypothetical protein
MRLFSPNALWFLLLVPLLVFMYILKQRYEEQPISSLYLWQQVLMDMDVTSPFQRIKKNILFFLQLLILLLCIFALTNPFVWWKNNNYENLVIVMDASGSMSALGEKEPKLQEAKDKAESLINSLSSGSKITLISAAKNFKVEVTGSNDKREVLKKLNGIQPTNSAGNMEGAYSLVKAICNQYKSYRVVYFTDSGVNLNGLNGEVVKLDTMRPNVSLDYIAQSESGENTGTSGGNKGLKVMVRVTNHGSEISGAEICLYGEDELISIKNESIAPGQTKTVYFDNVPDSSEFIYAELSDDDGLLEDNRVYSVVKQKDTKKILLSADRNIFLEKALNTLKDIELIKTMPGEKVTGDFDLYIYDSDDQGIVPKTESLLYINPLKDNRLFRAGQEQEGGRATVLTHAATKYMTNSNFVISKFQDMETPYWANPLLTIGEKTAAFAGEVKGQRIAVMGFDLHNSDFVLTPEFPIFINNLVSYLLDRDTMTNNKYSCGDEIELTPLPEAEKLFIKKPDGQETELSPKYPIRPFEETYTPGIYKLTQQVGDKKVGTLVAVNFPASESSLANTDYENSTAKDGGSNRGGINLLTALLILALLVITGEWVVYIRQ